MGWGQEKLTAHTMVTIVMLMVTMLVLVVGSGPLGRPDGVHTHILEAGD